MSPRQPAPPHGHPLCYGTGWRPDFVACPTCPVQRTCKQETARWAAIPSLAEALADAWAATEHDADVDATPLDIFARVWQTHYGYDPTQPQYPRQRAALKKVKTLLPKVVATCAAHGLDLATFITAQIHGFVYAKQQGWGKGKLPRTFPLNWLSGPGAFRRYTVYEHIVRKEGRPGTATGLDNRTQLGHLRAQWAAGEEAVAEEFCTVWRTVGSADWTASIGAADPPVEWRALALGRTAEQSAARNLYRQWEGQYGREWLTAEHRLAQLRAAFAVAQTARHGLPDRISVPTPWDWSSFARLLHRVCGDVMAERHRPTVSPALGGKVWRA